MLGAIALLAGAGIGGYRKMKQDEKDEARQKTQDDRADQKFQWEAQDRARQESERQALANAAKPVAMEMGAGGMTKPDYMDNADVGLAGPGGTADLPNGGLIEGGYKVQGKGYADQGAAQAEVDKQNTPEARVNRRVMALEGLGRYEDADRARLGQIQLEGAGVNLRSGKLALETAEAAASHDKMFREVVGQFHKGGWQAIPGIYDNYKDGFTANVQEDGKGGATITRYDADGKPAGQQAFASPMEFITSQLARLDPKLWVTTTQHAEDAKRAQGNADRTHKLREKEVDSKIELNGARAENMALRGALAAGRAAPAAAEPAPFNPLHDFDPKQARKAAMDQAIEESKNSPKPLSDSEIAKRAQGIYSATRDAAAAENVNRQVQSTVTAALRSAAANPAAYAEAYAKASQLAPGAQLAAWGFKPPGSTNGPKPAAPGAAPQQPMAIQAPAPAAAAPVAQQPTAPGPQPARAQGEPLQSFKARLVQWDQNRMAYEAAIADAAATSTSEQARRAALAGRPDLQRMGQGLR